MLMAHGSTDARFSFREAHTLASSFNEDYAFVVITDVSPKTSDLEGQQLVSVTGKHFDDAMEVYVQRCESEKCVCLWHAQWADRMGL